MYAVTGATGALGRKVIAALMKRGAPDQIVALVREPARAADLVSDGVKVRSFDYDAPEQQVAALDGVTRLLLISSPDVAKRVGPHRAVIDAARAASIDLLAYTSVIHADHNPISVAASHRETEAIIVASGLRYAILRNSWYIENYLIGADAAIAHGALLGSTGSGRISAASRADYAEGAAAVLTGEIADNRIYELGGDESFTLSDVAAAMSDAAERTVVYRDLSEADYRAALVSAGLPDGFAAALAEYSANAAGGILADGSGTLGRLIGRPTVTMREFVLNALRVPAA